MKVLVFCLQDKQHLKDKRIPRRNTCWSYEGRQRYPKEKQYEEEAAAEYKKLKPDGVSASEAPVADPTAKASPFETGIPGCFFTARVQPLRSLSFSPTH